MMQKRLIRSLRSRFHNYKFTVNGGVFIQGKIVGFLFKKDKICIRVKLNLRASTIKSVENSESEPGICII
jgi:hypothetical protein